MFVRRVSYAFQPGIQSGQNNQRQKCGAEDAANDNGGEWSLHFGAGPGGNGHWHKTEAGHERCHKYWPKASQGALDHSFANAAALFAKLIEIADHNQAIENGHTAKRDKSNCGGDAEGHSAQPQREHSTRYRQRNSSVNEQRLPKAAEGEKDQNENQRQCRRHDDHQTRTCLLKVLVLATEFHQITVRHFYLLLDSLLRVSNESFHVARI